MGARTCLRQDKDRVYAPIPGDLGSWLMLKSPPTACGPGQQRSQHVSFGLWDSWIEKKRPGPLFSVSLPTQSHPIDSGDSVSRQPKWAQPV